MSLDRYNTYLETHIDTTNIAPIRSYWVSNIVNLLPSNMRIRKSMEVSNLINGMVAEVKTDYILANKKSIVD